METLRSLYCLVHRPSANRTFGKQYFPNFFVNIRRLYFTDLKSAGVEMSFKMIAIKVIEKELRKT